MKKRIGLAAVGCIVMGSVFLSACASPTAQTAAPGVIQVQNADSADGKVSIASTETVKVTPDMAEIMYGITTEHENAAECQQENTKQLNQLLEYLKAEGFEDDSIQTSGFSMDSRYDWSNNQQRIIGYEMRTRVTVTNVPMDRVGSLLTKGVESGANEICSVSYFSSGYDEAYKEALTKAVELAKSKAEALAAAGGKSVGQVLGIEEYSDNQYGRYVNADLSRPKMSAEAAVEDGGAAMGIMPGEMEITASIKIEFELTDTE